jgi:7-keto-8-aminopelargonate synthetase-like enzyme
MVSYPIPWPLLGGFEDALLLIAELRNQERPTLYETAIRNKIVAAVKVSDAQTKAYCKAHPKKYMMPASRPVRHILVAKKSLAETIYKKLMASASFTARPRRPRTPPRTTPISREPARAHRTGA